MGHCNAVDNGDLSSVLGTSKHRGFYSSLIMYIQYFKQEILENETDCAILTGQTISSTRSHITTHKVMPSNAN